MEKKNNKEIKEQNNCVSNANKPWLKKLLLFLEKIVQSWAK